MSLAALAEAGLMDAGWARALAPVGPDIAALGERLRGEGTPYLPSGDRVLRAFQRPLSEVKVLIVGQDPYPTPGHPIGLSFAVDADVRPLPRSLANIYRELADDLGPQSRRPRRRERGHGDPSVRGDEMDGLRLVVGGHLDRDLPPLDDRDEHRTEIEMGVVQTRIAVEVRDVVGARTVADARSPGRVAHRHPLRSSPAPSSP